MSEEKIFSKGIYVKEPRENAPEFVHSSISIKLDDFMSFAGEHVNDAGYLNLDVKWARDRSKGLYCELNTYVRQQATGAGGTQETIPY